MTTIVVRLPDKDRTLLRIKANNHGVSLAEIVRRAVRAYLDAKAKQRRRAGEGLNRALPDAHRERGTDWSTVRFIVGTRDDLSGSGIKRSCAHCGAWVFTGRTRYPNDVAIVCVECAVDRLDEGEEVTGR